MGSKVKQKPDLVLVYLIDGCLRQGTLHWHDIQTLVKHTREPKPPMWMPETVLSKSYQIFCSQPKRDFIITLCITAKGFYIVVADHSGMVETDVIKITQYTSSVFVQIVMGLALLPDRFLGMDTTITHCKLEIASSIRFQEEYRPYTYQPSTTPLVFFRGPHNALKNPLAITKTPATEGFDKNFSTITISSTVYQGICIIFSAKSFIGHATRVFLV